MRTVTFTIRGEEYIADATTSDLVFFTALIQMTPDELVRFRTQAITATKQHTARLQNAYKEALAKAEGDESKAYELIVSSWEDNFARYMSDPDIGATVAYQIKSMCVDIPDSIIRIKNAEKGIPHRFSLDFDEVLDGIILPIFQVIVEENVKTAKKTSQEDQPEPTSEPAPAPVEVHQAIPAQAQPKREKPTGFTQKSEELASLPVPPRKPAPVAVAEPDQVDAILANIRAMPQTEQRGAIEELPKEQQEALFAKLAQAT